MKGNPKAWAECRYLEKEEIRTSEGGPHVGGSGTGGREILPGNFSKLRSSEIGFRATEASLL